MTFKVRVAYWLCCGLQIQTTQITGTTCNMCRVQTLCMMKFINQSFNLYFTDPGNNMVREDKHIYPLTTNEDILKEGCKLL